MDGVRELGRELGLAAQELEGLLVEEDEGLAQPRRVLLLGLAARWVLGLG